VHLVGNTAQVAFSEHLRLEASDRVAVVVGVLRGDDRVLDEHSLRGRDLSPTSGSCATQRCTVGEVHSQISSSGVSGNDDALGIPSVPRRVLVNPGQGAGHVLWRLVPGRL
jgi:hypothetical protein